MTEDRMRWIDVKHMYAYRIGFRVIMIYLLHLVIDVIKYYNLIHPFLNIFRLLSELGIVNMPHKWRPLLIIKHAFMSIKTAKPCHINQLANNKIKFLKNIFNPVHTEIIDTYIPHRLLYKTQYKVA